MYIVQKSLPCGYCDATVREVIKCYIYSWRTSLPKACLKCVLARIDVTLFAVKSRFLFLVLVKTNSSALTVLCIYIKNFSCVLIK